MYPLCVRGAGGVEDHVGHSGESVIFVGCFYRDTSPQTVEPVPLTALVLKPNVAPARNTMLLEGSQRST